MERDCNTQYIVYLYLISTHTLTWSVTADEHAEMWIDLNFNSHAHVERDVRVTVGKEIIDNFNSHAHVERDTNNVQLHIMREYFNSHAHVERDGNLHKI